MENPPAQDAAGSGNRNVVIRGAVLAIVLIAVVVLWLLLPTPTVDDIRRDIEAARVWGGLVFALGYGIASLVPRWSTTAPGSPAWTGATTRSAP